MEVTRTNFGDCLKDISNAIEESAFLAIDGEFTGLNHSGFSHSDPLDTPEERYYKLKQGSSDFLLIQFGLCAFSYNERTKQYIAKPFNCFIFPKPFSRGAPDCRFSCQSSSLDFLISQGFDFNKVFREGIPYLTPLQEKKVKDLIQKKHEQFSAFSSPTFTTPTGGGASDVQLNKGPVEIPKEHQEFIDLICKQVEKFLEKNEEDTLSLDPCTGFQRKLTYQTLKSKFSKDVFLETKTGEKRERYIVVSRCLGENQLKQKEEERQAQEIAEMDSAVGFSKVIQMISDSGKLVIGHNMFLDLAHTLHQFMYPLPEAYEEFKTMVRGFLPRLLDTKLMANTQPFKDHIYNSGLEALHRTTQMNPFSKPDIEFAVGYNEKYNSYDSLHEAGYDAYITGCCFIAMTNFLGQFQNPKSDSVLSTSPLLEPFINKIYMMRSIDIPYLDLAGPDLSPVRDYVYHVQFPKEWASSNIFQLFSPYGNIQISGLDDVSALVSLNNRRTGPESILKTLNNPGSAVRVTTYAEYKKLSPNSKQNVTLENRWTATHFVKQDNKMTEPKTNTTPQQSENTDTSPSTSEPKRLNYAAAVKRPAPSENTEEVPAKQKKLNVEAPVFKSRITPNTTPEKEDVLAWPTKSSGEKRKKVSGEKSTKIFAEPKW